MRRALLLCLAIGCGGRDEATPAGDPPGEPPPVGSHPVPAVLPASVPVADLVGARACAECHAEIYKAWQASPHGRSMMEASADTVLADFSGTVTLPDGSVTLSHGADGYFMEMTSRAGSEKHRVDLVLASGRQHQLYVVRSADGGLHLLPLAWSTRKKSWLPLSLYQPAELDPRAPGYWRGSDMTKGCLACHLSQAHRKVGPEGGRTAWVDLSINCESCHGPGREHIARRRAGRTDEVYRDLRRLSSHEEARVCGGCHGFQLRPLVFPPAADGLPQIFVTSLINPALRADGTQHLTSYQLPGHYLSGGYRLEVLTCKDCHQPHDLDARDHEGRTAEGPYVDRQCTACHPKMETPAALRAHSHHQPTTHCIDCHMSMSWIGDDDRRQQRTADHSISKPRPRETLELGLPNACTTCHTKETPQWALAALQRWGARDAIGVREWVRTIDLGRKRAPGATARLLALLADDDTVTYLRASALDLLVLQPPDPSAVAAAEPYARGQDPALRAIAIRALMVHDPAHRRQWQDLGLADPHPFVRMDVFAVIRDAASLSEAALARQLDDVLAYSALPAADLQHLITLRHKRGEIAQALALVDLLERVATPGERAQLDVAGVRARIQGR